MTRGWRNWAGNQRARPVRTVLAGSVDEVAAAVVAAGRDGLRVTALGSGHSFSGIGVPAGVAVRPPTGPDVVLDGELATVPAGMTLRALNARLWALGRALPNLGDIDAQTISGAVATGTHGTGARFAGIAAQVHALEIVTADGEVRGLGPEAAIGLGALGVVTALVLRTAPAFHLHAREEVVPLARALELPDLPDDHAEFYWFPHTDVGVLKRNNRTERTGPARRAAWLTDEVVGNLGYGAVCAAVDRVPALAPRLNPLFARWMPAGEYVDRSYRVFCSPRRVRFLEMEYAVPRAALGEAFAGLRAAAERHARGVPLPVEVRVTAADEVPLSTAHGRDSAYLAVHVRRGRPHAPYFAEVERVLRDLDGRPHWGKLHTLDGTELRGRHPGFEAFRALRAELDPHGRFGNPHVDRLMASGATRGD